MARAETCSRIAGSAVPLAYICLMQGGRRARLLSRPGLELPSPPTPEPRSVAFHCPIGGGGGAPPPPARWRRHSDREIQIQSCAFPTRGGDKAKSSLAVAACTRPRHACGPPGVPCVREATVCTLFIPYREVQLSRTADRGFFNCALSGAAAAAAGAVVSSVEGMAAGRERPASAFRRMRRGCVVATPAVARIDARYVSELPGARGEITVARCAPYSMSRLLAC